MKTTRGSDRPRRSIFYGLHGVGKTWLAAHVGNGIMIDLEEGGDHAPIDRYVFDEHGRDRPTALSEVYNAMRSLLTEDHKYTTLVIDGLDELERLIWAEVCEKTTPQKGETFKEDGVEGFHFQRGYKIAVAYWRKLAESLEVVRRRRDMAIVLVGHAETIRVQNPTGDDYDRYSLNVHKHASGFLYGWADVVGFMGYETLTNTKPNDKEKTIAMTSGARFVHLRDGAAWAAKARAAATVPEKVEVPFENPWQAVEAALSGKAA